MAYRASNRYPAPIPGEGTRTVPVMRPPLNAGDRSYDFGTAVPENQERCLMARKQHDPPIPAGLSKESAALFVKLTDEVDFPPEKLMQLEAMCRTLDVCAKLQAEVDALDSYRVRGSQGQPVSAPELADLARYRALIVSQARALDISDDAAEDDAGPRVYLTPSELGKRGAAARWGNRRGA